MHAGGSRQPRGRAGPTGKPAELPGRIRGVTTAMVEKQKFRHMVRTLREFEGVRSLWRVPIAGFLYVGPAVLLLATAVLGSYVASDGWKAETAVLSSVITLVGGRVLFPRARKWELHRRIVGKRLWTWEQLNPQTETPVHLRSADAAHARRVLRRAGFNPGVYGLRTGNPPTDAPDLDCKLAVHEPAAWPQSASAEDRIQRIVSTLRGADIRARVASVDT